jgi:hypothetical protein
MKNRVRESCTPGSVRDGGGNAPIYSAAGSSGRGHGRDVVATDRHVGDEAVRRFGQHSVLRLGKRGG